MKKTDVDLEKLKEKLVLYGYRVDESPDGNSLIFTSHDGTEKEIPWSLFLKIANPDFSK